MDDALGKHRDPGPAVVKTGGGLGTDGGNLYLDAWGLPSRNWVLRYTRNGKIHDHGLGSYPETSLAQARMRRDQALAKLGNGVDPVEEKRSAKLTAKLV